MNIYVGYLPEAFKEEELRAKFAQFGKVASAKIIKDRETGLSRGFAFVEMRDNWEAQQAIDELRTWEIEGKRIKVNVARDREERNNRFNW